MVARELSPMPVKGLSAPFLRPLPTIFTFASLAAGSAGSVGSAARRHFTAHLRAFKAIVIATARTGGIAPVAIRPLLARCEALAGAVGPALVENIAGLRAELHTFHQDHRQLLRAAVAAEQDRLRRLFRTETGPRRIKVVFNDETWPEAQAMRTRLVTGCWYDCEECHENEGAAGLATTDMVVLVPGVQSIRGDVEQAAAAAKLPVLALVGIAGGDDEQNMAALKTAHLYRQNGCPVLHAPFAAIRLYQAIDGHYLRHFMVGRTGSSPVMAGPL